MNPLKQKYLSFTKREKAMCIGTMVLGLIFLIATPVWATSTVVLTPSNIVYLNGSGNLVLAGNLTAQNIENSYPSGAYDYMIFPFTVGATTYYGAKASNGSIINSWTSTNATTLSNSMFSSGGKSAYFNPGTYTLNVISVPSNFVLSGAGNGTVFNFGSTGYIDLVGSSCSTLKDFTTIQSGTSTTACISLTSLSNNNTIENVNMLNSACYAIHIVNSDNTMIRQIRFSNTQDTDVMVKTGSNGTSIIGCLSSNPKVQAFSIYGVSGVCFDTVIESNIIRGGGRDGIVGAGVDRLIIKGNTISDQTASYGSIVINTEGYHDITSISITENILFNCRTGISVHITANPCYSYKGIDISHNIIDANDIMGHPIYLWGDDTTADIEDISVTSNIIRNTNGAYSAIDYAAMFAEGLTVKDNIGYNPLGIITNTTIASTTAYATNVTMGDSIVEASAGGWTGTTVGSCLFTSPATAGNVTNILAYIGASSGTINAKATIYTDAGSGVPDVLLASSTAVSGITTSLSWVNFTISCNLNASTNYWLGVLTDGATNYRYKAGSSNQLAYKYSGFTYPTAPNPFPSPANQDRQFSIYAVYNTTLPILLDSGGSSAIANNTLYINTGSPKDLYLSGGTIVSIEINESAIVNTSGNYMVHVDCGESFRVIASTMPSIAIKGW